MKKTLRNHLKQIFLVAIIVPILFSVMVFIPSIFIKSDVVSSDELKNYIEGYLSEYSTLVDENFALISEFLNNFTFYLHAPNEIEAVISQIHGAVVFFNFTERRTTKITVKYIPEPIEYHVWPDMPRNASGLPSVLVKAGDYHLDSPIAYNYGLLYLEPGVNMIYTGEGEGIRISDDGVISIFGTLIYEDRMILKGTNSKEDWSKIQARFDALSDFIWDCKEALNETKIEELNAKYKFFLLVDRIVFRTERGQYRDDPSLFRTDYEELKKVCSDNVTLSKVLNDYLEMQKNPPPTLIEQFLDILIPYVVAPVVVAIIIATIWGAWRWIRGPKVKMVFYNENRFHLGIFRYYHTQINRKHARIHVFNDGKTNAKNVRGFVEILEAPEEFPSRTYLHWADTPFSDPEPIGVDIPKDGGFKILDVVFSQPSDEELYEDYGEEIPIFTANNTIVLEYRPTPTTIPPEAMRDIQVEANRMANAISSGCYVATNLALWSPGAFPQYHLPPGDYTLKVTLIGENIRKISMIFRLTSPENWLDFELQTTR